MYMFPCYLSGFASRNVSVFIGLFDHMILLADLVHLIKREEGIHIHHLMVVHFLRIKVLFVNLLAHFCNGIDAAFSRKRGMKMKVGWRKKRRQVPKYSDKSRKKRKWMREKYERKENDNSVQNCYTTNPSFLLGAQRQSKQSLKNLIWVAWMMWDVLLMFKWGCTKFLESSTVIIA